MSEAQQLGQQIVEALEKKLETRLKRETRTAKGSSEPSLVLDALRKREETELEEQEAKYRESGDEEVAAAFNMVRTKLLRDVVRSLFDRLC